MSNRHTTLITLSAALILNACASLQTPPPEPPPGAVSDPEISEIWEKRSHYTYKELDPRWGHLFRFDEPLVDTALAEIFDALAPGGVVGVVQHRAPEDADDEFANGNNGYVKQSAVIAAFERAGFVLEETSEMNANPNDPADGMVWRLPPSNTEDPATMEIGESDRMTLRFRKPE